MMNFNRETEIQDLAEDLDKFGYIAPCNSDRPNIDTIYRKIDDGFTDDIYDWLNNCELEGSDEMIISGLIARLNMIQYFSFDMGVKILNMLVDALPQVQIGSADSHEYSYYSDKEDNCICVRSEQEAKVIADMLEVLSNSNDSNYDTLFGINEPESDGPFDGFWTVYQVD